MWSGQNSSTEHFELSSKRLKMKVVLFTSLAIFAACGLALADDGFFGDDNGIGLGGLGGWASGYGGGLGGYGGGLGGYGKAQYVPVPLPAQGGRGAGSGGFGGLFTLLLLLFILPLFFNRSSGSADNVILLNSTLRG